MREKIFRQAQLEPPPDYLLEVMSGRDKIVYWLLVIAWLVANIVFWSWWFRPEHIASPVMFAMISAALFYESTVLPSFYLFFLSKMRRPIHIDPKPGLRVAMVTLCVPSKESIQVIERQLRAMVNVRYPHDNWILDEGDNPRVKALAKKSGVQYFTRNGVGKYNQPHPPFQAKTKAGNVNAWINAHGHKYDYFTQLDIDHVPWPDYLDMVLGYFEDPQVAWVQAPSIYSNFEHWTARGSAEQELVLQGPLQMGFYGYSKTPFIIGSHSTYRMSAIMEIGGFQPTRAEDHLDTVVLAGRGYQGVFVPNPIAVGDGPEDFETYLRQQFAWAYSMIQVLLYHTPKYRRSYINRQKLQFLFVETWYPFWGTAMGVLFLLPALALLLNTPIAVMSFGQCVFPYSLLPMIAFGGWLWSRKWFQPKGLSLSWRGVILNIARWPVVLWALVNVILGVKKPYMITSKGVAVGEARSFNLSTQRPYLVLITLSLLSIWLFVLRISQSSAQGYLLFALGGTAMMVAVYAVALMMNLRGMHREGVSTVRAFKLHIKPLVLLGGLLVTLVVTSCVTTRPIAKAIAWTPTQVIAMECPDGNECGNE